MADPMSDLLTALRQARGRLADLLRDHPGAAEHVGEVLAELTNAEDGCARLTVGDSATGRPRTQKSKRYERHRRGGEEYVAEYRSDSPYPFRVPKVVLDAVVHTLATSKRPLRSGNVRAVVRDRLGEDPVDYQLHTCLRFLAAKRLVRVRSRTYAAIDPKLLRRQVAKIWSETLPEIEE